MSGGGAVMLWEPYAGSDAFLAHSQNVESDLAAHMELLEIGGVYAVGRTTPEAQAVLDQIGAVHGQRVVLAP